ncbi:uncharacterized protein BX664DRAFT_330646 [Halteromyces radiatus]|uniref:uncharacterized protein n=1 Tax=Halteromyces radiatus TaxID=101107 RepID=UPI00221F9F06|nr:uncharacterized protein BX664DRAFT_330646 [Halteromyces radiatus]KAI8093817.1 hypothetical protein BX664DRAFT_330646 [Halteromyces radiatus]
MQIWIVFLISLVSIHKCQAMQLRKHDQRIDEPFKEEVVLNTKTSHNITSTTKGCGSGTMTCFAFASDHTDLPVRCGTLTDVPLCPSNDEKEECNVFCDADGGARLCSIAFNDCCQHSKNGCISSQPTDIHLLDKNPK